MYLRVGAAVGGGIVEVAGDKNKNDEHCEKEGRISKGSFAYQVTLPEEEEVCDNMVSAGKGRGGLGYGPKCQLTI